MEETHSDTAHILFDWSIQFRKSSPIEENASREMCVGQIWAILLDSDSVGKIYSKLHPLPSCGLGIVPSDHPRKSADSFCA